MSVDIHQHLLYGLDDGANSFDETCAMMAAACREGVTDIIATPHAVPGSEPFPYRLLLERLAQARQWCCDNGLQLRVYAGSEIFYTDATIRLLREGQIPTLAGTRYVLMEFNPAARYETLLHAARTLGNAGFLPIFAHVERYRCLRQGERLAELHERYRIVTQVNARTILSPDFWTKRWLARAIGDGLIDIAASDAHNTGARVCRMGACVRALSDKHGADVARELCAENPQRVLRGMNLVG